MKSKWISVVRPATGSARYRVVVIPHAGAGPSALAPLWRCLPPDVEVDGVTLPGRERRFVDGIAALRTDPDLIIDAVLTELEELSPLPTVLFGHSLGAAIAAALVDAEPDRFEALVLSTYPGASTERDRAGRWSTDRLMSVLEAADGTPDEALATQKQREFLLEILRRDLTIAARLEHRGTGPFPIPLTVLHGADDELVGMADETLWQSRANAGLRTRLLPGGHFYLLDDPTRHQVADEIVSMFPARSMAS